MRAKALGSVGGAAGNSRLGLREWRMGRCCNSLAGVGRLAAGWERVADADMGCGFAAGRRGADKPTWNLAGRRCGWPFVDACSAAGAVEHIRGPVAPGVAGSRSYGKERFRRMGVGTRMKLQPISRGRLLNVVPD